MKGEAVDRSGVSGLLFIVTFGGLLLLMFYADRHFSDSLMTRRLHLERSLREANVQREQARALADAINGEDARGNLGTAFPVMGVLLSMAVADIYDLHRRLKKLESRGQQPLSDLQVGGR
jgi:hypothetical protein